MTPEAHADSPVTHAIGVGPPAVTCTDATAPLSSFPLTSTLSGEVTSTTRFVSVSYHCGDCVVTVVLGGPPYGVPLDDDEKRAIEVLADAGLVPPLRMVEARESRHKHPDA